MCSATFTRSSTGIASKSDTLIISFRHIGAIACAVIYVLPAQRYASAGTSYGPVSVCLSVCLSQVGVLPRISWRSMTMSVCLLVTTVRPAINEMPFRERGEGRGNRPPVRPRNHVLDKGCTLQCSRKRVQLFKKRKESCFWILKKTLKT